MVEGEYPVSGFEGVCVISNSRAEAGPLESVIAAMPGCYVVKFNSDGQSPAGAMSQAMTYFTAIYTVQKPKLVVVLGDRYETLAAALAAMFLKIPVAHIHGGETTTGAFDDSMRHAMTHIAELHFCATGEAMEKISDMTGYTGQAVNKGVSIVGAPGLDGIEGNSAKRDRKMILVTYHPETRLADNGLSGLVEMCKALKEFDSYDITFTGVNNDPGCEEFRRQITLFCFHSSKKVVRENLTHKEYIVLMQHAALVIGNSSAGVIEAPWVGCPSINLGNRQTGRPMAPSVFHSVDDIGKALMWVKEWKPIYKGCAAPKIAKVIKDWLDARSPT